MVHIMFLVCCVNIQLMCITIQLYLIGRKLR